MYKTSQDFFCFLKKSLLLTNRAFILSKVQRNSNFLKIFLLFKISVFYLNIFKNCIYSCDFKAEFLALLLQSHDPSEIILIFRFAAKQTFIIIIIIMLKKSIFFQVS